MIVGFIVILIISSWFKYKNIPTTIHALLQPSKCTDIIKYFECLQDVLRNACHHITSSFVPGAQKTSCPTEEMTFCLSCFSPGQSLHLSFARSTVDLHLLSQSCIKKKKRKNWQRVHPAQVSQNHDGWGDPRCEAMAWSLQSVRRR